MLTHGEQVGQQLARVELVGERVDHGHAGVGRHLLDPLLRVGAPHDRRRLAADDPGHVGHRLAHADAGQRAVDEHRVPAQLGDPGGERHLGAQRRLVVDRGDAARPGQRLGVVRRALERRGQVQHRGLLGGAEVVVGQEVAGHVGSPPVDVWASPSMPGQEPRNASASARVSTRGGASRIRSGVGALMMKPCRSAAAVTSAARGSARVSPISSPAPADLGDPGVGARPGAQVLAQRRGVGQQPVVADGVEDGQAGRAGDRVAAEGRPVVARLEEVAGVAEPDAGADRDAAAQPLREGDQVGGRGGALVGEPLAGAADPGLDLVEPEQGTAGRGDLAGGGEVAGRAASRPRPPPGWARAPPPPCGRSPRRGAPRRRRTARRSPRPGSGSNGAR